MEENSQRKSGYQINELARLFRRVVHMEAKKIGISGPYFFIINYLSHHQEIDVAQSDICSFLNLKAPTISITLQNMENEGYLVRVKSEEDNRKTYVKLTNKGLEKAQMLKNVFKAADELVESALSADELKVLYSYIDRMCDVLRAKVI